MWEGVPRVCVGLCLGCVGNMMEVSLTNTNQLVECARGVFGGVSGVCQDGMSGSYT